MKVFYRVLLLGLLLISFNGYAHDLCCFTGAFISDLPLKEDIIQFKNDYGKSPNFILTFIDWGNFLNNKVIEDVYSQKSILMVTWEPWQATSKQGIDFDQLLAGKYDSYIKDFSLSLKKIEKVVFLRFAHEMNGDWYPWSGSKLGKDKYIKVYRYVRDIFNQQQVSNVKWVFAVNWQDVPKENNHFTLYYPGDDYVDAWGIDGYNWGNSQTWSHWMSFEDIFSNVYKEISQNFNKRIFISEFGCASSGGDKALWIKEAIASLKNMPAVGGFILFNLNKEVDWRFPIEDDCGQELKRQLQDEYFCSIME